jgi:radical SAM protein with 4Fe4S-binding SPASM domain
MDLRSPAGAVLGCLAYNHDGSIYVSDEGRMAEHEGDPMFRVGHVAESRWTDVLDHPTSRACVVASTLENQPLCGQCAYKPYCGVEPVFHYESQASVWGRTPDSGWCKGYMGAFDLLFDRLRRPEDRRIFEAWMERDQCRWEENPAPNEAKPGEVHA